MKHPDRVTAERALRAVVASTLRSGAGYIVTGELEERGITALPESGDTEMDWLTMAEAVYHTLLEHARFAFREEMAMAGCDPAMAAYMNAEGNACWAALSVMCKEGYKNGYTEKDEPEEEEHEQEESEKTEQEEVSHE